MMGLKQKLTQIPKSPGVYFFRNTKGEIIYNGQVINDMPPNERAKLGLFLSFQYPSEIEGVTISTFLRTALNSKKKANEEEPIGVLDFHNLLKEKMKLLK